MFEEEEIIRAFVVPSRRKRLLWLIDRPERRQRIRQGLAHFKHLDPRYAHRIPGDQHDADGILRILERHGAGSWSPAYLISEDPELDRKVMPLEEAIRSVVGRGMATLVSCRPGALAYFEDEGPGERYLLVRGTT